MKESYFAREMDQGSAGGGVGNGTALASWSNDNLLVHDERADSASSQCSAALGMS